MDKSSFPNPQASTTMTFHLTKLTKKKETENKTAHEIGLSWFFFFFNIVI